MELFRSPLLLIESGGKHSESYSGSKFDLSVGKWVYGQVCMYDRSVQYAKFLFESAWLVRRLVQSSFVSLWALWDVIDSSKAPQLEKRCLESTETSGSFSSQSYSLPWLLVATTALICMTIYRNLQLFSLCISRSKTQLSFILSIALSASCSTHPDPRDAHARLPKFVGRRGFVTNPKERLKERNVSTDAVPAIAEESGPVKAGPQLEACFTQTCGLGIGNCDTGYCCSGSG